MGIKFLWGHWGVVRHAVCNFLQTGIFRCGKKTRGRVITDAVATYDLAECAGGFLDGPLATAAPAGGVSNEPQADTVFSDNLSRSRGDHSQRSAMERIIDSC